MNKNERRNIQDHYINKMIAHLPTLRSTARITQNQLAKKLGVTRSTVVVIESRKRPLQWYMYLALVLVFMQSEDSRKLLESFEMFDEKFLQKIF